MARARQTHAGRPNPQDMLYGELATGSGPAGRPVLLYKDVCKRDLKAGNINSEGWVASASDRNSWRFPVKAGTETCKRGPVGREERHQRVNQQP